MDVRALSINDLSPGMSVHYRTTLDAEQTAAYAEMVGDVSPLHVDPAYGKQTSFGTNLVHGMLVAGHFSTIVGVFLPGRSALLAGMDIDFVNPVPVGSEMVISGKISGVQRSTRTIEVSLRAFLEETVCVSATASVRVREEHDDSRNGAQAS